MKSDNGGNSARKVADRSPGPWTKWRCKSRAEHCIRWIETYIRITDGADSGKRMVLGEWQKQWIRDSFAAGVTISAMSVARGAGKSSLLAAIALWSVFCDDDAGAPQVVIAGVSVLQAGTSIFGRCIDMVRAEPELADRSLSFSAAGNTRLEVPSTGGKLLLRAADEARLQGLTPSLVVLDEGGFVEAEIWRVLVSASAKRAGCLVITIGTPGVTRTNALWNLRESVRKGKPVPGLHYVEYSATPGCDVTDEDEWAKANPAIGEGRVSVEAMRTMLGSGMPEVEFRRYQMGEWTEADDSSWLGDHALRDWMALADPYEWRPDLPTFAGLDLSLSKDTSALVIVQLRPDGRWAVQSEIWTPNKETGERIDLEDVRDAILRLDDLIDLRLVAYDPAYCQLLAAELDNAGVPMAKFTQGSKMHAVACSDVLHEIKEGRVSHDGDDEAFNAQVCAASTRPAGALWTLQKSKSRHPIDAAVALVMALSMALVYKEQY